MKSSAIVSLGIAGALLFGSTQVDWNSLATKAAIAGTGASIANGLLHKGSGANISPMINNSKAAENTAEKEAKAASKAETAKKVGKGLVGATVVGGLVIAGTQLAEPAFNNGVNDLGKKLDEPLNENDNNKRDAYCMSMPSIQGTSGCK